MKHLTISKIFTAFLLVGLILSACDGVLPSNVDLDSSDNDSNFSKDSSDLDSINDDGDDDISSSSSDDGDDGDSSSSDDDEEIFTATVDAVDGNTVTINGQVYTVNLKDGLLISDYLTAGQTIEYTIDDNGEEIKIFIDGLGDIELKLDDDDDSDEDSSSSLNDDDDHDDDSDNDHDGDSSGGDHDDHSSYDDHDDEEHDSSGGN